MSYLIDTNIFMHARDGAESVLRKFEQHDGAIVLSALSLAELQRGLDPKLPEAIIRRERHGVLMQRIAVIAFDVAAAEAYGRIIAQCGRIKPRDFDHMIAAHAISERLTLVTDNEADFVGIPGLALENWVAA
ncbi:MAG TPA: type II toxin-antitoxin system VapC family toxin [Rhizomicrobium sp.]|nr:type II toxin-antitoxin system VapC family toxin [Rhizomicrobium sp.]